MGSGDTEAPEHQGTVSVGSAPSQAPCKLSPPPPKGEASPCTEEGPRRPPHPTKETGSAWRYCSFVVKGAATCVPPKPHYFISKTKEDKRLFVLCCCLPRPQDNLVALADGDGRSVPLTQTPVPPVRRARRRQAPGALAGWAVNKSRSFCDAPASSANRVTLKLSLLKSLPFTPISGTCFFCICL